MRFILTLSFLLWTACAQAGEFRGFTKMPNPVDLSTARIADAQGQPVAIGAWRGTWIVLNLWAAWCAPCVAELPTLEAFAKNHPLPDMTVIAVSTDTTRDTSKVIEFLNGYNIGLFAAHTDPQLALSDALKPMGLPLTYLVDPRGRAVAQYRGAADWSSPQVLLDVKRLMSSGTISKTSPTKP